MKWTNSLEDTNYQSFTQEEIDNKNSPVSVKQIEFITENLQQRKLQTQMASLVNSNTKLFKE